MKFNRFALCLICITMIAGCQPGTSDSGAASQKESGTSNESGLVFTDQGWTEEDRTWFYNTGQGSRLIQYTWMMALEQPDNQEPFLADDHIESLRFLPRRFDPNEPDRAEHLPVGFAKDGSNNWLGFTCAGCHTTELEYDGKRIRIDGGGTLADADLMLTTLTASIKNTVNDNEKFERFANRALGNNHSTASGIALAEKLNEYLKVREDYNRRNVSPLKYGYARLDAFGRIFNKALWEVEAGPDNFNPPDAPVSYPFLWGTDQSDWVQWVGNAGNANIGRLARNTGEVLGVFAQVNVAHRHWLTIGYPSSAATLNQIELEQKLRKLNSPVWPDILPPIDEASAGRGAVLYGQDCAKCHNLVDRTNVNRKVVAWMEGLDTIKTDPKTAHNIVNRSGKTGYLEGRKQGLLFGDEFGAEAPVLEIVSNEVLGMLMHRGGDDILDELISWLEGRGGGNAEKQGDYDNEHPFLAYKGRSLSGVWATAPFLHNGSVPSLWQLLTPPENRVKTFYVGSRKFDPKEVGLEYKTN